MNQITLDDVVNYLSDSIDDPALIARIEVARESNPKVAKWFVQLQTAAVILAQADLADEDEVFPMDYVREMIGEAQPTSTNADVPAEKDEFWRRYAVSLLAAERAMAEGTAAAALPRIPESELKRVRGRPLSVPRSLASSSDESDTERHEFFDTVVQPNGMIVCRIPRQDEATSFRVRLILQDANGALAGSTILNMEYRATLSDSKGYWFGRLPLRDVVAESWLDRSHQLHAYCIPEGAETKSLFETERKSED